MEIAQLLGIASTSFNEQTITWMIELVEKRLDPNVIAEMVKARLDQIEEEKSKTTGEQGE